MKKLLTGNHAVAEAVRLCRPEVVAAYPITPQTPIYEKLSEWENEGSLGGIMMRVESEHSAMAACLSASLTGVRTFTATASQGLALMHEMLFFAAGCRTAVVMAVVNRTLAAPWAFWSDQTDSLAQRDTGWLQLYCEDNQESLDTTIQGFKIAEELLLPVMVILEANYISHFMEPVDVPSQEEVDSFLPKADLPHRFEVDNPGFSVPVVNQTQFQHYRILHQEAMTHAIDTVQRVDQEFQAHFGRGYGLLETVNCEDAELVLLTTATITSTSRLVIAKLREQGRKVGLCRLRLFRPFPHELVRGALAHVPKVAVLERNLSPGREGIFCTEVKAALVNQQGPRVQGYLAGLGGSDVGPELIEKVIDDAMGREEFSDGPIWMEE